MIDQCAGCRIGCSWDCVILVIHNVIFAVENQIIMQCLGLVKIAHARGHIVLDDLLDETVEFGVFFSSFLNFCGTVLIVYLYPGWRTILFSTGTDACNIILVLVGPTVIQAVQYFSELLAVYTEGRNINFRFYILESINNRCFRLSSSVPESTLASAGRSSYRLRNVTIWARVQLSAGEKQLSDVPDVISFCLAQ